MAVPDRLPNRLTPPALRRGLALLGLPLLLSACALPGPAAPAAPALEAAQLGLSDRAGSLPAPAADWWTSLGDAQLDRLVSQALAAHPSLAQAQARLAQARALADAHHAGTQPQAAAGASLTRERFTEHGLYPPPYGGGVYNNGTLQATLAWSPDFFGRLDAEWAAQVGQVHAAQADLAAARLALATQVSRVYLQLAQLQAQRGVAERALQQREELLELTRQRVAAGLDTALERTQGEGALPEVRNQIEALAQQIMLARHALAALTGQSYQALDALTPELPARLPSVAGTLGADLLARRPDVTAARWRAEAAGQSVQAARAAFYPDVNLHAFVGLNALSLGHWLELGSRDLGGGPAVHLPLFDGGLLQAQLSGSEAGRDAAVAQYNTVVLGAVREAADALGSLASLERQQAQQAQALASAEQAWSLARERYRAGLGNYLAVLNAESQWLQQRRLAAELTGRRADAWVSLAGALGGGWRDDTPSRGAAEVAVR